MFHNAICPPKSASSCLFVRERGGVDGMIGRHSVERGGVRGARRVVDRRELILCLSYLQGVLMTHRDYLQTTGMTPSQNWK